MSEPIAVDEMTRVLGETIGANALRLTSSRGGYVGGGQPHPTLDSDPAAIEAVARGLLARKVAEPSRVSVAPSESLRAIQARLYDRLAKLAREYDYSTRRDAISYDQTMVAIREEFEAAGAPSQHTPDTGHRYRIECDVCGQRGQIVLSVEPQHMEEPR